MSSPEENMSPEDSPGDATSRSGVRRVNNLPMYIVGALLSMFIVIMVLVASDRAAQQAKPAAETEYKVKDANTFAVAIAGSQKDGIVPAAKLEPAQLLNPSAGGETFPPAPSAELVPQSSQQADANQMREQRAQDDAERIRMAKLARIEEAMRSKTSIPMGTQRSSNGQSSANGGPASRDAMLAQMNAISQQIEAQAHENPLSAYKARLKEIQGMAASSSSPADIPTGGRDGGTALDDRWRLDAQVQPPRSRFELRAGSVLPAILISGINSELPGQIMGQVSQDVFDTATGNWKLIPQGARLVGRYSSDVAYGQARVLIAWQRIVFPDGKAMDIGSMPGADSAGYAGFTDQVNNHYLRIYSSAILMSSVTAGIALSQPQSVGSNSRPTAGSAMSEALGQQLGQVTSQLITKNMNIAPTLEIRPGYRFNVVATKDLTFSKPYQPFDY